MNNCNLITYTVVVRIAPSIVIVAFFTVTATTLGNTELGTSYVLVVGCEPTCLQNKLSFSKYFCHNKFHLKFIFIFCSYI